MAAHGTPQHPEHWPHPHEARSAYVAFDGHWDDDMKPHLFRTSNGGTTWQSIVGDLPDWKPVKAITPATGTEDVRLFPLHPATQAMHYRDFPQPGGHEFIAANPAAGAPITYGVKSDPPAGSASDVRISVLAADGSVLAELTGPDGRGTHRVVWDLRYQFMYVPPPEDSGFYGPAQAAYVPPGRYTVKLSARGRDVTQPLEIRWDPRGVGSPDALRRRFAINISGREVSRVFFGLSHAIDSLGSELARLDTISRPRSDPNADSTIRDLRTRLTQIRARASAGVRSLPGGLFDLLPAIETSSLPPTDAQRKLIEAIVAGSATAAAEVNAIITRMPVLRARLGQPPTGGPDTIRPPR